jgi:photosystem II stability/assembly factor-like uncharacterized protein
MFEPRYLCRSAVVGFLVLAALGLSSSPTQGHPPVPPEFGPSVQAVESQAPLLPVQPVEEPFWQTYPISGGEIISLAVHPEQPETVYAGTRDGGVFRTTDGAETWEPRRGGLTFFPIRTLVIHPGEPDTLYAGTDFDGIWKTTDGGLNWKRASTGLDIDMVVFQILIDPSDPDVLYASLGGGVGMVIGAIYKSTDGGSSWQLRETGIPHSSDWEEYINGVFCLVLDPAHPGTLYAGTLFDGAFKTTNGGDTWTAINQGMPVMESSPDYYHSVNALALDPYHANRLVAIIEGRYYTYGAAGWQKISTGMGYASSGLFRSDLWFHPTESGVIYCTGDRLSVSRDDGLTWEQLLGWDTSGHVSQAGFHPSTPGRIYAATEPLFNFNGGVYRSDDGGEHWDLKTAGLTAASINSVATDPQDPQAIFAGSGSGTSHVYYSYDGGANWGTTHLSSGSDIHALLVDPLDSQVVYATNGSLQRSTDRGQTFEVIEGVEQVVPLAITPGASGPIYAGAQFGEGVYKSEDGLIWTAKTKGLPLFGERIPPILSLAVDPHRPQSVWAGMQFGGGLSRSDDAGETWHTVGFTDTNFVEAIAFHPTDPQTILVGAGSTDGRIYKSTDGGKTWEMKEEEIAQVKQIVYDPRNPDWVYAATEGFGVLRSFNGGESWRIFNPGLFYPFTYELAWAGTPQEPILIAPTYGSGLYHIQPGVQTLDLLFLPFTQRK